MNGNVDHKEARAEARGAKAHAKALRPWYKKKRFIIPAILVALIIIIAAASGGGTDDTPPEQDTTATSDAAVETESDAATEADDVTVSSCSVDEIGWMVATLDITNNSSKRSTYFIDVVFESPDGSKQFSSTMAMADNLEPGQSTSTDANALDEAPEGEFTCRVTNVQRDAVVDL